jgi:hypothetical protein
MEALFYYTPNTTPKNSNQAPPSVICHQIPDRKMEQKKTSRDPECRKGRGIGRTKRDKLKNGEGKKERGKVDGYVTWIPNHEASFPPQ